MNSYSDRAIVLSRIDYGEKDRILTLLCQKHGKLSVLAKSVRSSKSRLSGGIELLSESDVTFIDTRTELKTLTGARLNKHFGNLSRNLQIMQTAFDFLKTVNSVSENGAGQEFYPILLRGLESLNRGTGDPRIIVIWFNLQALRVTGSAPNLEVPAKGSKEFEFSHDEQKFIPREEGPFTINDIKLIRLCGDRSSPPVLKNELGSEDRLKALVVSLLKTNLTEV